LEKDVAEQHQSCSDGLNQAEDDAWLQKRIENLESTIHKRVRAEKSSIRVLLEIVIDYLHLYELDA